MSKASKIKLSLKGGGLSYTADVDPETAAGVMALCLPNPQKCAGNSYLKAPRIPSGSAGKESPVEYLNRHAPRRNPDKILTIAGYAKEALNKDFFYQNEIRNLFKDAGEMLPANFNRDFRWTIRNGWIAKDHAKKNSFYVTNTGLKVLQSGFPDELVKRTKGKSSHRKKSK